MPYCSRSATRHTREMSCREGDAMRRNRRCVTIRYAGVIMRHAGVTEQGGSAPVAAAAASTACCRPARRQQVNPTPLQHGQHTRVASPAHPAEEVGRQAILCVIGQLHSLCRRRVEGAALQFEELRLAACGSLQVETARRLTTGVIASSIVACSSSYPPRQGIAAAVLANRAAPGRRPSAEPHRPRC